MHRICMWLSEWKKKGIGHHKGVSFPLGKQILPVQIRLEELLVLGTWSEQTSGRWTETKAHRRLESHFLCFCVPRCRDICLPHMGPCDFPSAVMQIMPPPKLLVCREGWGLRGDWSKEGQVSPFLTHEIQGVED